MRKNVTSKKIINFILLTSSMNESYNDVKNFGDWIDDDKYGL